MFYASLEKTQDELILLTEEIYNGYLEYDEWLIVFLVMAHCLR
jgi:hypothetical protein